MAEETKQEGVVRYKTQAYEVQTQYAQITDESIIEARKLVGIELRSSRHAARLITADSIRRFAMTHGMHNPLYLDEGYAVQSRWGGLTAPPGMIGAGGGGAPGLRGIQWLFGGTDTEFVRPVRPGDIIQSRGRVIDAVEKRGGVVPRFIIQYMGGEAWNQRGEVVARGKSWINRIPRSRAAGGMKYEYAEFKWKDGDLEAFDHAIANEPKPRGAEARYWEDVQENEELGTLAHGPLRVTEIAFTGASFEGGHIYQLEHRRQHPADTYIDPEKNIQDHPHRGHWEPFMAKELGMRGMYDIAGQRIARTGYLAMLWAGDDAFLRRLKGTARRPTIVGDMSYIKGKVVKKAMEGDTPVVYLDVWVENARNKEISLVGQAEVVLLSKEKYWKG